MLPTQNNLSDETLCLEDKSFTEYYGRVTNKQYLSFDLNFKLNIYFFLLSNLSYVQWQLHL